MLVEIVLTAILLIAVFGTAIDSRRAEDRRAGHRLRRRCRHPDGRRANRRGDESGALVRSGSRHRSWDNCWIWIVGPLLGAAIVGLAYRYLFLPEAEPA